MTSEKLTRVYAETSDAMKCLIDRLNVVIDDLNAEEAIGLIRSSVDVVVGLVRMKSAIDEVEKSIAIITNKED